MAGERTEVELKENSVTVRQVVDRYLAAKCGGESPLSKSSQEAYKHDLIGVFVSHLESLGVHGLVDLRPAHISSLQDELGSKLSPASVSRTMSVITSFLNRQKKDAMASNEVVALIAASEAVRAVPESRIDKKRCLAPLEEHEAQRIKMSSLELIAKSKDAKSRQIAIRNASIFGLLLEGIGPSAVVELKGDDVTVNDEKAQIVVGENGSKREITIGGYLPRLFEELKNSRGSSDFLFVSDKHGNSHLTRQAVWLIVEAHSKKEIGKGVCPKELTDTFIVGFGGNAQELATRMGISLAIARILLSSAKKLKGRESV